MFSWSLVSLFAAGVAKLLGTDECHDATLRSPNHEVPNVRSNFGQLIATNPNYFGNAAGSELDPVQPLANDVRYEELIGVGFNPGLDILTATIEVKLDSGFNGDLCTNGSYEYVRFWVDYGTGWGNVGYVSVNTHDIMNQTDCNEEPEKPLFYTLSLPFTPTSKNCSIPVFPNIRAILSWNAIPSATDPNWSPVWGNPLDQHIQARLNSSLPFLTAQDAVFYASSEFDELEDTCAHNDDTPRSRVRDRREPARTSDSQEVLDGNVHQTAGDTRWEKLTHLGLDFSLSSLIATIEVKRPEGFGTDPCHNGTNEYVSFWADWNNTCNYTFLDTRQINVHDFASLPPDGLAYTAIMPVDTTWARSSCNETKIARVRAALSWATPPPEPPALPTYGNWLEKHVQLQPWATPPGTQGEINVIGDIAINYIATASTGMTLSAAQFSFPHILTDPSGLGRPCPFGGLIRIQCVGCTPPPNTVYRLMARPFNPLNPSFPGTPIGDPITVVDSTITPPSNPTRLISALDADGYFPYLPPAKNLYGDLAAWRPSVDGLYQIRLETATTAVPRSHIGYTPWYRVRVNNEVPVGDVQFTSGTCDEIFVGEDLNGVFFASMPQSPQFLEGWSLGIIPAGIPHAIVPPSGTDAVPPDGNGKAATPWVLETALGQTCGYVVDLYVRALTVYNSFPIPLGIHVYRGFCLRNSM